MENITLTGIDLSKNVFEVRCENHTGRVVHCRRVLRSKLTMFMSRLPKGGVVAMEACGTSHYWARQFQALGLKVLLIAPQFVVPFRKSQKNDSNDVEAICEAARRPGMRFVAVKSEEQLDIQALHRARERIVKNRTALMNQLRGFLLERGHPIPQGVSQFRKVLGELLPKLEGTFGGVAHDLWREFHELQARFEKLTKQIEQIGEENEVCRRLQKYPSIGPLAATTAFAAIGSPEAFKNGRNFAASLGLVPRQFSSGGRIKLGGISKRGDCYLRKLLIHGARTVVRHAVQKQKTDPLSLWIRELHERCGTNRTAVALANKTARRIWADLAGKQPHPKQLPLAA